MSRRSERHVKGAWFLSQDTFYARSVRKAYTPDAPPFVQLMDLNLYVPPPLPAEFKEASCIYATPDQREQFFQARGAINKVSVKENDIRDKLWSQFCSGCEVKNRCFEWAMAYETEGIWAGTTAYDRSRTRKDPEVLEYGRNRLAAGHIPFKSPTCDECGKHTGAPGLCPQCKRRHTQTSELDTQKVDAPGLSWTQKNTIRVLKKAKTNLVREQHRGESKKQREVSRKANLRTIERKVEQLKEWGLHEFC